jgi:GNAT superfamily N-acetyltransferase
MPPTLRPARADELPRAQELVVASMNDLTERHGFGPIASLRPLDFQTFSFHDDPSGFWIAEGDAGIVGYAFSWVSGDLWFLAELFVEPTLQGEGIGGALMARTLAHAQNAGATTRALITFPFNAVSQGLYIRRGLLPRLPLYFCRMAQDALRGRLRGDTLDVSPIEPTAGHSAILAELDRGTLGTTRERHHRFLLGDPATKGVFLHEGGDFIGYAYTSATGHVGPIAVAHQRALGPAFKTALALATATEARQVTAFLPGASDAIGIAVGHGMQITLPMVLVSDHDFGDWTRYLPRNPGFM